MARKYGDQNGISKPAKKSIFDRVGSNTNEGKSVADYAEATPEKLTKLVVAATGAGGGVLFSRTSDGGAFSLTLFVGDERKKIYCPGNEEIDDVLDEWSAFFIGLKDNG